jgi:biotin carboxyl carrier protein
MKFYRIRVDGADFKVGVEKLRDGVYRVKIGDREAEVVVEDVYEKVERKVFEPITPTPAVFDVKREVQMRGEVSGGDVVTSMLPGVVLKVLVKPGDRVKAGEPVVIVESMKMENEIVSPVDGVVGEVLVREGQRIEAGDVVATIQPVV